MFAQDQNSFTFHLLNATSNENYQINLFIKSLLAVEIFALLPAFSGTVSDCPSSSKFGSALTYCIRISINCLLIIDLINIICVFDKMK